MPTISVIIPVYNGEQYIAETLESVCRQSHRDLEILVANDGSRDRSVEIVEQLAQEDARIQLLHHEGRANRGVSQTRKLALSAAQGEFIAFLDADDAWESEKLEQQLHALNQHPEAILCHTGVRGHDSEAEKILHYYNHFMDSSGLYHFLEYDEVLQRVPLVNSSVLCRAAPIKNNPQLTINGLTANEDWLMWVILAEQGPFHFLQSPLTWYRQHPESYNSTTNAKQKLHHRIDFLICLKLLSRDSGIQTRASECLQESFLQLNRFWAEGVDIPATDTGDRVPSEAELWKYRALEAENRLKIIENSRVYGSWMRFKKLFS